jgi:hypothetical protein
MLNIENDENIRVNIRTGTSTRAPCPRSVERPEYYSENIPDNVRYRLVPDNSLTTTIEFGINGIPVNSYQDLMSLMNFANFANMRNDDIVNSVLGRSMNDTELRRDPTIRLNIRSHHCKTTEIDGDCPVCQSKFKLGDKLSTLHSCKHTFHHDCLQEWGKYKQECPLCRSVIPILER